MNNVSEILSKIFSHMAEAVNGVWGSGILIVFGFLFFGGGVKKLKISRWFRRKKWFEKFPVSSISNIKPGLAKISGKINLIEGNLLKSPISSNYCVYYDYCVEIFDPHSDLSFLSSGWFVLKEGVKCVPFCLKCVSEIIVDLEGAKIGDLVLSSIYEYELEKNKDIPKNISSFLESNGISTGSRLRFTERYILPDVKLSIIGTVKYNDCQGVNKKPKFVIARGDGGSPCYVTNIEEFKAADNSKTGYLLGIIGVVIGVILILIAMPFVVSELTKFH